MVSGFRTPRARRPGVVKEIRQFVARMAEENPTWGYTRIRWALKNIRRLLPSPIPEKEIKDFLNVAVFSLLGEEFELRRSPVGLSEIAGRCSRSRRVGRVSQFSPIRKHIERLNVARRKTSATRHSGGPSEW
jgi:hypothetical protein